MDPTDARGAKALAITVAEKIMDALVDQLTPEEVDRLDQYVRASAELFVTFSTHLSNQFRRGWIERIREVDYTAVA